MVDSTVFGVGIEQQVGVYARFETDEASGRVLTWIDAECASFDEKLDGEVFNRCPLSRLVEIFGGEEIRGDLIGTDGGAHDAFVPRACHHYAGTILRVRRSSMVTAAIAFTLIACTGGGSGGASRHTTTTTASLADLTTAMTRPQQARPGAQLVSCAEQIFPRGYGPPSGHDVTIGPLTFRGLADSSLAPLQSGDVVKSAVTIRGHDEVTVALLDQVRPYVGLVYRQAVVRRSYQASDGDAAVTFATCGAVQTSYGGAFIVTPPARCVVFTVYVGTNVKMTRGIPFGGRVPCGPTP